MKKLLVLFLFVPIISFSQEGSRFYFTGVVQIDSVSKDNLLLRSEKWIYENFRDIDGVIEYEDKPSGQIRGNGLYYAKPVKMGDERVYGISFKINIYCKDGRYKYELTDFKHINLMDGPSGGSLNNEKPDCGYFFFMKSQWESMKNLAEEKANLLITDFNLSMNKKSESESNW